MSGKVLVVDDEPAMCEMIATTMIKHGYEVEWRTSGEDAFRMLQDRDFDVVVTDLKLKGSSGLELCERISENFPDISVVVITAFGSMETAVAAIRVGAYDFITKPMDMDSFRLTIDRAVQHRRLSREVKRLRQVVSETQHAGDLIGSSPAVKKVQDMIDRVCNSETTILITGESGTGKELVARALHHRSIRANGPFVAINCAAMPPQLLESELFGHVRGAFTDAKMSRQGLFVQASGGTLFLDEIGEMPLEMQAKLLRVLQDRKVRPVGSNTEVAFDTRIIAATNRDLESDVEDNRFREDLYYRINVVRIHVPPLRSRGNDILMLAQQTLSRITARTNRQITGISSNAAQKLLEYDWPGNVRELENCLERAIALTHFEEITVEDLPERIRNYQSTQLVIGGDNPEELPTLQDFERRYIRRVLKAVGGNKTQAATVLGLDRRTLYRKLDRYDSEELPAS